MSKNTNQSSRMIYIDDETATRTFSNTNEYEYFTLSNGTIIRLIPPIDPKSILFVEKNIELIADNKNKKNSDKPISDIVSETMKTVSFPVVVLDENEIELLEKKNFNKKTKTQSDLSKDNYQDFTAVTNTIEDKNNNNQYPGTIVSTLEKEFAEKEHTKEELEQTKLEKTIEEEREKIRKQYLDTQQEKSEQEKRREAQLAKEDKKRTKRIRRLAVKNALYDIAYYGAIASWAFLGAFIIGRLFSFPPLFYIGMIGSLLSVAASIFSNELVRRMDKKGRGICGIALMVLSVVLCASGFYGMITDDMEWISAGVIGLFVLSFFPSILDSFHVGHKNKDFIRYQSIDDESYYEHPPHASYRYSGSNSQNVVRSGFSAINEVFGIPQPQDPPPIEITRDDIYDDDYWDKHITVEIERPGTEFENIIFKTQEELEKEHNINREQNTTKYQDETEIKR